MSVGEGHRPRTKKVVGELVPPPSGTGVVPAPTTAVVVREADPGRVWLTVARKYRVAQYESLTVDLGASTSVDPGETQGAAHKRLFEELLESFGDVVEVMKDKEGM